jgi:EAL domain-containing protein (putative c-di-GMP-specific phosphodiesterase class I)
MDQKCCTYGRIYADIFGICMAFENVEEVFAVAKKIRRRVGRLAANYYLKLSSGIYVVEDNDMNMADIYDRATLASHQSKGKYMVFETLYTKEMGARIVREQLIINEMDHALKNQEFVVYYQPKYEVKERSPKGAEALVRWKKPDGTMVSPGEFIPIFEKNGFITKLDYYMWEKVCQFIKRQLDAGMEIDPISANVSRVNLYNPKFLDSLIDLVEKYKIPPRYLHLELTESAFSEDVSVVQNVIKRLHKVGFTILMDDFGSAYSSLNVLKDIQMDVLKIDMKFLSHGNSDARGRKILEAIINMAVSLDMPVIAEGVEEEAQVEMLERLGCNYIQGYYFARPMPEEEYVKLITEKSMQSGSIQKKAAIE